MSEYRRQEHREAFAEAEPVAAHEAVTGREHGIGSEPAAGLEAIPEVAHLLAALRDASPQPGLEQRVARAVRRRAVMPISGALWRVAPHLLVSWSLRAGAFPANRPRLVAAGVLAGAAAFLAVFLLIPTPEPQPPAIAHLTADPSEHAAPVSLDGLEHRRASPSGQMQTFSDRRIRHSVTVTIPDTERRLRSYPAPPEPLTAEEKSLLKIARAGDPAELALLNPEVRAQHDAQEAAAFEQFVNGGQKRP